MSGSSNVIAKAIPGASGPLGSTDVTYYGFTIRETSGTAAATVRLRAGGATGLILETIALTSAASARAWHGPQGIRCDGGLYVEIVTGAVEGTVRLG